MSELITLEDKNILTLFSEKNGLDPVLDEIKKIANEFVPDLKNATTRKEIASMANKIAKSKTYLDGLGKELVSEWKEKSKKVDAERKRIRDELDALKEQVRKPLTDFELAEKERIRKLEENIELINSFRLININEDSKSIEENLQMLINNHELDWENQGQLGEYKDQTKTAFLNAKEHLIETLSTRKKYENEQAELEALRKEKEVREKKEYEEKLKREAAEKAKREAEEKAQAEKIAQQREKELAEKRAIEAEERAKKLEQEKIEAEKRAKLEKEKAEKEAIERERKRIEAEQAEKERIERIRQENIEHQKRINNEAVLALMSELACEKDDAIKIVSAIAQGKITNIKVIY